MPDVAVFGTAAADVVVRVRRLPSQGEHLSARSLGWRLGGGSANVACALAAAGHRVELVGPFGNDQMGDALLAEVARRGVGTARSFRVDAPAPRALIFVDDSGERTILGFDRDLAERVYPLADVPHVEGVGGVYVETYSRFPTAIAEQAPDALLVVGPPPAGATHWPADVVVGSEEHFPSQWADDPFGTGRAVAGPRLRWVVVTRGARGANAYGLGTRCHVAGRPATQVDATGAGDAFAAGLMSALLRDQDIEAAMTVAAELGAAAVEVLASIPMEAIEALCWDLT